MSEQTQRINTADFPSVSEAHADEALLVELASGRLPSDEEASLRGHLNVCAACRERLEALHLDDGTGATRVRDPMVGATLGEYRVEAALARGGMGVVYRGVHPMIGKQVAIKVLVPELDDDGSINRLLDEARAVNAIRHPNIIDIFSFGSLPDGRHYFVMELLDGKSLEDVITERRTLSPEEVMTVLEQSCSALGAAHLAGVVHRDLKPANLFLSVLPEGAWHVTVLDFGLAKRVGNTRKTATNVIMGTPGFMAPEQIRGKPVSPATDLYAMGAVAWVLLTGSEPFQAEGVIELMHAHLEAPLPSLQARAPRAPSALVALIERMLAKRPEDRPGSALEVRSEVQRIRAGGGRATGAPLVRSPVRRPGLVPAGMPSSELADAVAGTHVPRANAETREHLAPPRAAAPSVEPVHPAPVPVADRATDVHPRLEVPGNEAARRPAAPGPRARWPWAVGVVAALLALGGGAWVSRTGATTSGRGPYVAPPEPVPPLARVETAPELPTPALVAPPAVGSETPAAPAVEVDAGLAAVAEPVRDAGLAAPASPTPTVKRPDVPVDRRRRLGGRLQKLETRFVQAVARGASLDLELAEVRGLRQALDKRGDERSLETIETAVQRLEGIKP